MVGQEKVYCIADIWLLKSTGLNNNMDDGSIPSVPVGQYTDSEAGMHTTRALDLKQMYGIQTSFILLFTLVQILQSTSLNS